MSRSKHLYKLVCAALLCAVGIVIPMFMPKIIIEPMSFTLASHVAIFLAMFISPGTALAVCLGTTLGFFITTPFVVAARAASHVVFACLGAIMLQKKPEILDSVSKNIVFSLALGAIHAICEVIVVIPLFINGSMAKGFYQNGFFVSIVLFVGLGTLIHSMVDYSISLAIWKPISKMIRQPVQRKITE